MIEIFENYSLKDLNTFKVDATAKYFVEIFSEEELIELLSDEKYKPLPKLFLGEGSNILFTKDFDGLVIKIGIKGIEVIDEEKNHIVIKAGAGEIWDDLVNYCVDKNYGGIENLSYIPGTVGAAPMQNIGAYGVELNDVFFSLRGIHINNYRKETFFKEGCQFSYRNSIFKTKYKNSFIITSVNLKLSKKPVINIEYDALNRASQTYSKDELNIQKISELVREIRRSKLPDIKVIGNAGSFFKNPIIKNQKFYDLKNQYPDIVAFKNDEHTMKLSAGWLIEKCGLKGYRVGDVGIHKKQALVIVNYGSATGNDIIKFSQIVKNKVFNTYGITLIPEVNYI